MPICIKKLLSKLERYFYPAKRLCRIHAMYTQDKYYMQDEINCCECLEHK